MKQILNGLKKAMSQKKDIDKKLAGCTAMATLSCTYDKITGYVPNILEEDML